MAMEPVLLACLGCGVRIRTRQPEVARTRACPRCNTPLAAAVDQSPGIEANRAPIPTQDGPRPTRSRRQIIAAVALFVAVGSLTALLASIASTGQSPAVAEIVRSSALIAPCETTTAPTNPSTPTVDPAEEPDDKAIPDLAGTPASSSRDPAILGVDTRDLTPPVPAEDLTRPRMLDRTPPPPVPANPIQPVEPRRLLVRNARGRAIVAREYGMLKGKPAVILPDGELGWPESLVVTDQPFVPLTMDEMKRDLLDDPEFAAFRVLRSEHYLIAYQCTDAFARSSVDLLEKLHGGLTAALKKIGLPIRPVEFPLIAVIFATEDDFRANRRVAPDVQAYYEILSNRIFFYERSRRDQDAPEVSALRKPQTVAHEGTHQILHNVGIQPRMSDWPLWLVEGLAEYCSPTRFAKKGVEWAGLGQPNPIHLATIRDLEDPLPDPPRGGRREPMIGRDQRGPLVEYLATRKDLTPTDYAFSWALTHYLANQRLDAFVAYVKRMSQLNPFEEQSPSQQLAAFRDAFGSDLLQLDGKVAKHLKRFKANDALPFYAVIFEQPVGPSKVRRHYLVSQSPSVVRQWIDSVTAPEGGPAQWRVFPHPTRKRALEAAEQWIHESR